MPTTLSTAWYNLRPLFPVSDREKIRSAQQKIVSEAPDEVYCQLHNKDIPPNRCVMSQFQKECLGCSAATHLCHSCKIRKIAFGAVELCSICLNSALAKELKTGKLELPFDLEIPCLLIKKSIKVQTCRKMQSKKCRECAQPSRLCLDCKKNPARYPNEGLCLSCLVKNFGEGWTSARIDEDEQNKPRHQVVAATNVYPVPKDLLAKAIILIIQEQGCSLLFLARSLDITPEQSGQIREYLVTRNVLRKYEYKDILGGVKRLFKIRCRDIDQLSRANMTLPPELLEEISHQTDHPVTRETDGLEKESNADIFGCLSKRERELVNLLVKNFKANKFLTGVEIGEILKIRRNTVYMHLKNIYKKLGIHTKSELIIKALGVLSDKVSTPTDIVRTKKQNLQMELWGINIPPKIGTINSRQKSDILIAFANVFESLFGEATFGKFLRSVALDIEKFSNIKSALKDALNEE